MYSATARPRVSRRSMITLVIASAVACVLMATAAQSAFATFNCITLTPATATNQLPQQSSHTVTATVRTTYDPVGHPVTQGKPLDYSTWWLWYDFYEDQYEPGTKKTDVYNELYPQVCNTPGAPALPVLANAPVTFSILSGPNASTPSVTTNTDANGEAKFTWGGTVAGTDTVQASVPHFYDPANSTSFGDPANVTALKNWLPPITPPTPDTPVALAQGAVITVPQTCQKRKFYVSSSSAGGSVKKIVLKIDGKTAKVSKTAAIASGRKFLINTGAYSSGSHSLTLTTYFTDGSKVVKTGKFKLCTVRTSQRRVSPQFTG